MYGDSARTSSLLVRQRHFVSKRLRGWLIAEKSCGDEARGDLCLVSGWQAGCRPARERRRSARGGSPRSGRRSRGTAGPARGCRPELVNLGAGPEHGVERIPGRPGKPARYFEAYLAGAEAAQVAVLAGGQGAVRDRVVAERAAGSAAQVCPGAVAPLELRCLDAGHPGQWPVLQPADEHGHCHVALDIGGQGNEAVLAAQFPRHGAGQPVAEQFLAGGDQLVVHGSDDKPAAARWPAAAPCHPAVSDRVHASAGSDSCGRGLDVADAIGTSAGDDPAAARAGRIWRASGGSRLTVRPIIAGPSRSVTGRIRLNRAAPESCPQGVGPLSSPATITGPAGHRFWRRAARAGGNGEPGVRAHGQSDVPVPGRSLADLVVVQRGLVLGGLERSPGVAPCNAALILAFAQLRG